MGSKVTITNVNKDSNYISYVLEDGESQVKEVVLPAQVKFAKIGKAEIILTANGKVSFIKGLEPKPESTYKPTYKPMSSGQSTTMEILEDVKLSKVKEVYDSINATDGKKCMASTLFRHEDGLYDAVIYVTSLN